MTYIAFNDNGNLLKVLPPLPESPRCGSPEAQDSWELVDFSLQSLDVQIQFGTENGTDQIWRWVSNTMERTGVEGPVQGDELNEQMIGTPIDGITILGVATGAAEPQLLPPRYQEIELLPPVDPYFEEGNTEGNIYNNQGEGIAFYALTAEEGLGSDEGRRYLIAEMQRQPDGQYTLDYRNSDFVGTFQELNEDSGLYVTSHQGQLYFRGKSNDGVEINTSRFLVTALDHGDIRPGDDFLLQFALKDRSTVRGSANIEDVCAIFDHKMVWRANLYIDEGAGNADWNNRHLWNSEHNEWNYNFDGETFTEGNGGQTLSFLNNNAITPIRYGGIANAVAYDYILNIDNFNAQDSPFDFTYKMYSQQQYIRSSYANNDAQIPQRMVLNIIQEENGSIAESILNQWSSFYAPTAEGNTHWMNFIKEENDDIADFHPYLPGLGFLRGHHTYTFPSMVNWVNQANFVNSTYYTAGVDCSGFVKNSASYRGESYRWVRDQDDIAERYNSTQQINFIQKPRNTDDVYRNHDEIISRTGLNNGAEDSEIIKRYFIRNPGQENGPTLEQLEEHRASFLRIVPGDKIQYETVPGNGHVGIIHSINRQGIIEANNIADMMRAVTVIESIYGGYYSYVTSRNMMQAFGRRELLDNGGDSNYSWHIGNEDLRSWEIGRLEVDE